MAPEPAAVAPFDFPDTGRGQRALRDVRKGEVLARAPLATCFTESAARAAPELAEVVGAIDAMPHPRVLKTPLIAIHVLSERRKGAASARAAHIESLPSEFDTPLHWTDEQLEALRGTAGGWHAFATRAREEARADYAELERALGAAALERLGVDREGYLWASSCLQSRVMDVAGAEPLMAPFLDLFNHTADARARGSFGLDEAGGAVVVRAYRDFRAGEQVCISYGAHTNPALLFSYGFCLPPADAPSDSLELVDALPFGPACADAAGRARAAVLLRAATQHVSGAGDAEGSGGPAADAESAPSPPPLSLDLPSVAELGSEAERAALRVRCRHALSVRAPLPASLLVLSRLRQLDDAALADLEESPPLFDAVTRGAPISADNERAVLAELRARLGALRTALDSERAPPDASHTPTGARRVALAQRLVDGERAILSAAEAALDELAARAPDVRPLLAPRTQHGARPAFAAASGSAPAAGAAAPSAERARAAGEPAEHARGDAVEAVPLGSVVEWGALDPDADADADADASASGPAAAPATARALRVCAERGVRAGAVALAEPVEAWCLTPAMAAADVRLQAAVGGVEQLAALPSRAYIPALLALVTAPAADDPAAAARADADGADGSGSAPLSALIRELRALERGALPAVLWPDDELRALEGSRWLAEIADAREDVAADFSALEAACTRAGEAGARAMRERAARAALVRSGGALSRERFARACAAVRAATLAVRGEQGEDCDLVCPALVGGCVHSDEAPARAAPALARAPSGGALLLVVRAHTQLERGERLPVRLGAEPSGELLARRGWVLAHNAHERVELSLTLPCSSAHVLEAAMLCAPDAPVDPLEASAFEFVRVPTEAQVAAAGEGGAPLVTRHSLSRAAPLPPALLALLRLERCTSAELRKCGAALAKRGAPLWAALQSAQPLSATNELHALNALEAVAASMLDQYGAPARTAPAPAPANTHATRRALRARATDRGAREACAALLVGAESSVLRATLAEAAARRLGHCARTLERLHTLPGKQPGEASPWSRYLRLSRPRLDAHSAAVGVTCARLHGAAEAARAGAGAGAELAAREQLGLYSRVCAELFGWLFGVESGALLGPEPALPAISSISRPASAAGGARAGEYGRLFADKVCLWGCFLLAQWAHATTLGFSEMNTMLMESVDLRAAHSWSVPCDAALELLISARAPLALAGDTNGVWAAELRARGASVHVVAEGAPPPPGHTLVLVWLDSRGAGTAGLELVRAHPAERLAAIGEWRGGRTLGAYAPGLSAHGQSFSAQMQEHVEAEYELEAECALPNWPLTLDKLLLFRRRRPR